MTTRDFKDALHTVCITVVVIFFIKGCTENFEKELEIRKNIGTSNK